MANKVALVTGAAAGIGAACAKRLAKEGVAVGVLDLDEARCADTVQAIKDARGDAIALGADVSKRDQVFAAVQKLRDTFGPVNILVNNAGVTDFTPFEEVTDELWDFVYAVNVRGPMIMTQAVLPDMKAAQWGSSINFGSSSWMVGEGGMVAYTAAKSGVLGLTRSLARDYGPYNIRVNAIAPGWILTERQRALWLTPEAQARLMEAQCLKRELNGEDVARVVLFLCSDEAGAITSQQLLVDGGRL